MIRLGENTMLSEITKITEQCLLYDYFVDVLSTIILEIIENADVTITDNLIV